MFMKREPLIIEGEKDLYNKTLLKKADQKYIDVQNWNSIIEIFVLVSIYICGKTATLSLFNTLSHTLVSHKCSIPERCLIDFDQEGNANKKRFLGMTIYYGK